jgi:multiple sugar transport system ATP-binding protein
MASVSLEGLSKVYPNGFRAVDNVDLEIAEGEFMVLVGPSGCGKTTLLRMVAGLEDITSGTLRIDGQVTNDVPPGSRDIAMVFQSYALFPHMTVASNIGFPLTLRHMPKKEIDRRVTETAKILGLSEWLSRKPGQLSGGQRQRVAMGRAIVRKPTAFLMDEPLSNLDAKLRVQMRAEVSRLQRRLGVATLYVTHDQTEALTMGHRVAVLRSGVLQQCDVPQALYDNPANLFVAAFIGSPEMNLYEAVLAEDGTSLKLGSQEIPLPGTIAAAKPRLASFAGRLVIVGLRPEHLPAARPDWAGPVLRGDVSLTEGLGSQLLVHFSIDATRASSEEVRAAAEEELDESEVTSASEGIALVDARAPIRAGERASFAVDVERMHFFDPDSGLAISDSVVHQAAQPRRPDEAVDLQS